MVKRVLLTILLLTAPALARRHKRVPEYRAFPPSYESLLAQNAAADALHLPIITNDSMLRELVQDGELVPLRASASLLVTCPKDRAVARPWVAATIQALADDYRATFNQPLRISSATRPLTVQRRLRRWNHNAAPIHGEAASVHMRGIAVDVARRVSPQQKRWLQLRLLYLWARGLVIVEEELHHPCFHVVVIAAAPAQVPTLPAATAEVLQP